MKYAVAILLCVFVAFTNGKPAEKPEKQVEPTKVEEKKEPHKGEEKPELFNVGQQPFNGQQTNGFGQQNQGQWPFGNGLGHHHPIGQNNGFGNNQFGNPQFGQNNQFGGPNTFGQQPHHNPYSAQGQNNQFGNQPNVGYPHPHHHHNPWNQQQNPWSQEQNQFGPQFQQPNNGFGQGIPQQNPYNQGQNPFQQSNNGFGQGIPQQNPYNQGQNPFQQQQPMANNPFQQQQNQPNLQNQEWPVNAAADVPILGQPKPIEVRHKSPWGENPVSSD